MKHILNNLSEEEKNAIREQHAGGMKVMTENFSKLINAKLGDSKPLVEQPQVPPPPRPGVGRQTPQTTPPASQPSTQGILGLTTYPLIQIINGSGTSDQKVKSLCNLCRNTKSQITSTGNQLADKIRDAVQGAGTDESKIIEVIRSLRDFNEFCSMVKAYQSSYNADLYSDLDGDIDQESEWDQIYRPLRNCVEDSLLELQKKNPCKEGEVWDDKQQKCVVVSPTPVPTEDDDKKKEEKKKTEWRECEFPLVVGCKGENVRKVQECLGIDADGKFGRGTKKALNSNGYGDDVSKEDYDKIIAKCGGSTPSPTPTPYQVNPSIEPAVKED